MQIISIDIETSAPDHRGSILSFGAVNLETKEEFYRLGYFPAGVFMTSEAMDVNGITWDDLKNSNNPTLSEIDLQLRDFLPDGCIAMGRGVGYFDMGFIAKDLPLSRERFARRLFDLTGSIYGVSEMLNARFDHIRSLALDYAADKCQQYFGGKGNQFKPHHALYDAWENVFVVDFLKSLGSKTGGAKQIL